MDWDNSFYTLSFCAWKKSREKETEMEVDATMEG
jgi:hypothetical protein